MRKIADGLSLLADIMDIAMCAMAIYFMYWLMH